MQIFVTLNPSCFIFQYLIEDGATHLKDGVPPELFAKHVLEGGQHAPQCLHSCPYHISKFLSEHLFSFDFLWASPDMTLYID